MNNELNCGEFKVSIIGFIFITHKLAQDEII